MTSTVEQTLQPGQFITLEGTEGVGKSTNLEAVCACLSDYGIDFYQTREPGGTAVAEALRGVLLDDLQEQVFGISELLIFFAARKQHLEHEIKPRLAKGQWVVCDRFTDATYAYQGTARGIDPTFIEYLEEKVQGKLQPNLTILLDLDPEIAFQRIADREKDRLEKENIAFYKAVREGYLQRVAKFPRMQVVDASKSLLEVQEKIKIIMQSHINQTANNTGLKD